MKIERSTVTKVKIFDAPRLDPITVFLEDLEPRRGRITITCWDQSWTASWGGMGDHTVAEFFCSCSEGYLAGNLASSLDANITDSEAIEEGCKREIIMNRRGRWVPSFTDPTKRRRVFRDTISQGEARELWEEVEGADFGEDGWSESDLMQRVFGEEWWYRLPTKPNPKYEYLCRIISAVKGALEQIKTMEAA
jgi:hypothetical protein